MPSWGSVPSALTQSRVPDPCATLKQKFPVQMCFKVWHRGGNPDCLGCTGKAHFPCRVDIYFDCCVPGQANSLLYFGGFCLYIQCGVNGSDSPYFTLTEIPAPDRAPFVSAITSALAFCSVSSRCGEELGVHEVPPGWPLQVRVPRLGELGLLCPLAAQWVCTRPPFGYLTNTGSQKGVWHIWQSFLSERQTELPFSFILSYL